MIAAETGTRLSETQGMVCNILTVDVECWFHAERFREQIPKASWQLCRSRVSSNVRTILDILRSMNIHATFFILGWVADTFPETVAMISEAGHEIGTHGYFHKNVFDTTPDEFEYDLVKSLEALSGRCPRPVRSHRACGFSIVRPSLWAFDILARYGIENDASIMPIERKPFGLGGYPHIVPHEIVLADGGRIREFPAAVARKGRSIVTAPSPEPSIKLFTRCIDAMNMIGAPATVSWCAWQFDGIPCVGNHHKPRHGAISAASSRMRGSLETLLRKYRFGSIEQYGAANVHNRVLSRPAVHLKPSIPSPRRARACRYDYEIEPAAA